MITWNGGRCYTCSDSDYDDLDGCAGAAEIWSVETVNDCDAGEYGCADLYSNYTPGDCPTYVAEGDVDDGWVPFLSDGDDLNGEETGGPADQCSCTAAGAASAAELISRSTCFFTIEVIPIR
jgi:hypothetical protein